MWRMSANSIATTSATPLDRLQAYRQDEEEFYGLPADEELTIQLSSDEDEDELSISDCEHDGILQSFSGQNDSGEVMIASQDVERRDVRDHMQRGCGCSFHCYSQFTEEEVFLTRLQMQELDRSQRDFYLLGKLQVLGKGSDDSVSHARKTASSKRQRVTYQYAYDHRVVCKEGFLYLHSIEEKVLKISRNILKRMVSLSESMAIRVVKGIRKFQHFILSEEMAGKVIMKHSCDRKENTLSILQKGITIRKVKSARLPSVLSPPGITQKRQEYLHTNIAPYIWPEYRDITCPPPQ